MLFVGPNAHGLVVLLRLGEVKVPDPQGVAVLLHACRVRV